MVTAVLVTGGAGFIGSHACVELILAGYDIIIVDNFSNSRREVPLLIERITGGKAPVFDVDVRDRGALEGVFKSQKIDSAMHFAGLKAVGESVISPLKYYRHNIDATLTLCECMKDFGVDKLVFSSSATVYSKDNVMPLNENSKKGCSNPYGWTKLMIEQILKDVCASNQKFSAALLRYFNPAGAHKSGLIGENPLGKPDNLVPCVAQTAAGLQEKLLVFGDDYPTRDGSGVRDYIHVVDLARGHVDALKYIEQNTGALELNLGTGKGSSVFEVICAFEEANDIKIPYEIAPRRGGDLAEYYADPKKAYELLGWKAKLNLHDMCEDMWRFQKMYNENY